MRDAQPLNAETGAVHAAALCDADGRVRIVREDVGRHNAFDKLIGAMLRGDIEWNGGFALLSSRCSYELVEKAALSGCPTLVTISAPTGLATDRARDAGLRLIVLARANGFSAVLTIPCDTPDLPIELLRYLANSAQTAYLIDLPVAGYWPVALHDALLDQLAGTDRSMRAWVARCGAKGIASPEIANVNRPDDLANLSGTPIR